MRVMLAGEFPQDALRAFAGVELLDPAPGRSDKEAFVNALDKLHEADVLVADASAESTAVGWAIAWMLARGRLVIVCHRSDAPLPSLLAGNPSPWARLVPYSSSDELTRALAAFFPGKS